MNIKWNLYCPDLKNEYKYKKMFYKFLKYTFTLLFYNKLWFHLTFSLSSHWQYFINKSLE